MAEDEKPHDDDGAGGLSEDALNDIAAKREAALVALRVRMAARDAENAGEEADEKPDDPPQDAASDQTEQASQSDIDDMMARRQAEALGIDLDEIDEEDIATPPDAQADADAQQQDRTEPEAPAPQQAEPAPAPEPEPEPEPAVVEASTSAPSAAAGKSRVLQWALLFNSTLVLVLLAVIVFYRSDNVPAAAPASTVVTAGAPTPPDPAPSKDADANDKGDPLAIRLPRGEERTATWAGAKQAYLGREYKRAFGLYRALYQAAEDKGEGLIGDFLLLRLADCLAHMKQDQRSRELYERLTASEIPLIRAVSHHRLGQRCVREKEYLRARRRAYKALAALGGAHEGSQLMIDCEFLIARSLTEASLSFFNPGRPIPWRAVVLTDPFADLGVDELRQRLAAGSQMLLDKVIEPEVRRVPNSPFWLVRCNRAGIKAVLDRYAAEMGVDVRWTSDAKLIGRREVSLRYAKVTIPRAGEVACGSVGLISRFVDGLMDIYDPQASESSDQRRKLLQKEAVDMLQRFLLRWPRDSRAATAHLALARIYELAGDQYAALKQYQITADRFTDTSTICESLVRSAQLRIKLLDYRGASQNLLDLIDTNPDARTTDETFLELGRATLESGLLEEATRLYRRVYYQNLSPGSRAASSLGLGKSLFRRGMQAEADKWLRRYVGLETDSQATGLAEAHLLLGRIKQAGGDTEEACRHYYRALACEMPDDKRVELLLHLAQSQLERNNYVQVLGALRAVAAEKLSDEHRARMLLVESKAYRTLGLSDRAGTLLYKQMGEVSSDGWKAVLEAELARTLDENGEVDRAYATMSGVLIRLPDGAETWAATCDLAEMALKLDKPRQAVALLEPLLASSPPAPVTKRAAKILCSAYIDSKQFDKARQCIAQQTPTRAKERR